MQKYKFTGFTPDKSRSDISYLSNIKPLRLKSDLQKIKNLIPHFSILGRFSYDVGIDLGTANTLIWVSGKGIVIREPSVVARSKKIKDILAIGNSAKKMMGRAPANIEIIRPLRDGVIADFDATEAMLSYYIKKIHETGNILPKIPRPRVVIGIPAGVTEVERRAVADVVLTAGAREVHLIQEPMAAAIGADIDVLKPDGIFIVDIGGGTSEMAVISLGGVVVGRSIRIAGDEMNEAIINYVRLKYSLLLGETTAEEVKINIGSCTPSKKNKGDEKKGKSLLIDKYYVVRGRDLETGLPKSLKLSDMEIREALSGVIQEIVSNIVATLEETPPELVSDIMDSGIVIAGGGAMLPGLDAVISESTKMPVYVAEDPLTCVVRGCGKLLENRELLNKIKITKGL